jgi:tetratricopeptide (TPR) repeat protein
MGRYYWNLYSIGSLEKSLEFFDLAIKADSTYALAYAGMADINYSLASYNISYGQTPTQRYDKACKLAQKALQIDSRLPEAYAVLGIVYSTGYWQWETGGEYFEKAMKLDSNNTVTLCHYSRFLNIVGEFNISRKYIDRALELAPYSIRFRRTSSYLYYGENKPKQALAEMLMLEQMQGNQFDQQEYTYWCYLNAGDTLSALQYMQKGFESTPSLEEFKKYANQIFPVYKTSGLAGIYRMMYKNPPDYWFAVEMDSTDAAVSYLKIAYEYRRSGLYTLLLNRDFVKLHNDPRFMEIVEKTHLTPYFNKRYKK